MYLDTYIVCVHHCLRCLLYMYAVRMYAMRSCAYVVYVYNCLSCMCTHTCCVSYMYATQFCAYVVNVHNCLCSACTCTSCISYMSVMQSHARCVCSALVSPPPDCLSAASFATLAQEAIMSRAVGTRTDDGISHDDCVSSVSADQVHDVSTTNHADCGSQNIPLGRNVVCFLLQSLGRRRQHLSIRMHASTHTQEHTYRAAALEPPALSTTLSSRCFPLLPPWAADLPPACLPS